MFALMTYKHKQDGQNFFILQAIQKALISASWQHIFSIRATETYTDARECPLHPILINALRFIQT